MDYEWDGPKRQSNLEKHGVDFDAIHRFQWETSVRRTNTRRGELRFVAYGYIGERIHAVIYTVRDGKTRVISLRKANARERREYEQSQP